MLVAHRSPFELSLVTRIAGIRAWTSMWTDIVCEVLASLKRMGAPGVSRIPVKILQYRSGFYSDF